MELVYLCSVKVFKKWFIMKLGNHVCGWRLLKYGTLREPPEH